MVLWDDLGFATNYEVDDEPEFPADGDWRMPEVQVHVSGSILGGAQAVVTPDGGSAWVLKTHFADVGWLYATPDPDLLCVVGRFEFALIVDTRDPSRRTDLPVRPASVSGAVDEGFLLIADEQRLTAVGLGGNGWTSQRLFDDDLHIRRTDNGRIVCRGWNFRVSGTEPVEVTLDARTGEVIPTP